MPARHAAVAFVAAFACTYGAAAQAPGAAAPKPPVPAAAAPSAPAAKPAIDPDAKAVWDRAVAATRALKSVEMRSQMRMPDGAPLPTAAMPEGLLDEHHVVIAFAQPGKDDELGMDGGLPGRVRIERMAGGVPAKVLVMDAKGATLVDRSAKTWCGGEDWTRIAGTMMVAIPDWYMEHRLRGDKDAEARELLGAPELPRPAIDRMSLAGSVTLDGVECDVVRVHRRMDDADAGTAPGVSGGLTETYALARGDGLPRRITRTGDFGPDAAGGVDAGVDRPMPALLYTGVRADPAIEAKAFSHEVPEGFTKVEPAKDPFGFARAGEPGGTEAQIPALKVKVGDPAPAFALKDADGAEVTLASLRGRVVVLDFWATWCGPCRQAMPAIQRIHEDYEDKGVAVLGVNAMEPGDGTKAKDHMKSAGCTYRCLLKGDGLAGAFGITAIPTLVVIGKDGRIAFTAVGFEEPGADGLRKAIDRALAK
jgi:thiol-disulfide isomerase/thioredoxin